MPLKPTELERVILEDGWVFYAQKGSHKQYKHPSKPGKVTIPFHKVHTAVSSGSWCGGQRQQCGDSGSGLR